MVRADREYVLLESGTRDAQAKLLALHGFLDHGGSFGPLADRLPDFLWAAPDLPGHGASPHLPAGADYSFFQFAWDVVNILDALDWSSATLVGHSMGGGLAAAVAAAVPDRIERLVMIDSAGPLARPVAETAEGLGLALRRRTRRGADGRRVYPSVQAAREVLTAHTGLSSAAADVLMPRLVEAVEGGFRWRSDPRLPLPSLIQLSEAQCLDLMGAIQCPVLWLTGDRSRLKKYSETFDRRAAAVKNLVRRELAGAHHVHLDEPDGCARALKEFLR